MICEVGDTYGHWTIVRSAHPDKKRNTRWLCQCACGIKRKVLQQSLRNGMSTSCGCATKHLRLAGANQRRTHGETVDRSPTPEYQSYIHMKMRCLNPRDNRYHRYGGRGITVCKRWMDSFENFISDMGRRPTTRHQIDRIDNDGNYEPGNCRWATAKRQARNRSTSVEVEVYGAKFNLRDLCDRFNGDFNLIYGRLKQGWPIEAAITRPRGNNGGKGNRAPVIDIDLVRSDVGHCQELKMLRRAEAS